jgi:hypothetical protein
MMRSWHLDLLDALLPLLAGYGAFLGGKCIRGLRPFWRVALLVLAVGVVALLVVAYFTPLKDWTDPMLYRIGGETFPACLVALFLLGVVWGQPGRSTSSTFLAILVGLIGIILLVNHSGRLSWRWLGGAAWNNRADANGCVTQTTGWSCSPAAAVMLLHHHRIDATEGEMAYRARTNFLLGTSVYDMADAVSEKVGSLGGIAEVRRDGYEAWMLRGEPFLAHVTLPNLGGHALYVEQLTDDAAKVIDPRFGQRTTLSRPELERIWDGRGICLTPREGTP